MVSFLYKLSPLDSNIEKHSDSWTLVMVWIIFLHLAQCIPGDVLATWVCHPCLVHAWFAGDALTSFSFSLQFLTFLSFLFLPQSKAAYVLFYQRQDKVCHPVDSAASASSVGPGDQDYEDCCESLPTEQTSRDFMDVDWSSFHPLPFAAKSSEGDKSHASSGLQTEADTWNLSSGNFLRPWNRMRAGMGRMDFSWLQSTGLFALHIVPPGWTGGFGFPSYRASVLHQHFVRWGWAFLFSLSQKWGSILRARPPTWRGLVSTSFLQASTLAAPQH